MTFRLIVILMLFCAPIFGQSWQCRNDLEISCASGNCKAKTKSGFTPMSVSFNDMGKMSVCAYSGCWRGVGEVFRNSNFITLIGNDLKFSTSNNAKKVGQRIAITLDKKDNIAVLKVGAFAHPLICESKLPEFVDHKIKVSKAKSRPINFRSHKDARMFRTRLRRAARGKANFAGHFIYANWGCGTSCLFGAIINTRTGDVYFPKELAGMSLDYGETDDEVETLQFKRNSRLFIIKGYEGNAEETKKGTSYLVWQGTKFKRIKFIRSEK